jgi:hypothetical protein
VSWEIARQDPAAVHLGAPPAERESETEARPILIPSFEGLKQLLGVPVGETAAFVLDLDEHAIGAGRDAQAHPSPRAGELEGILKEIRDDGRENLAVGMHSYVGVA